MFELFQKGGLIMYPILGCSILLLAFTFERLFTLAGFNIMPIKFLLELEELIKRSKIEEAMARCRANSSTIAKIIYEGLQHVHDGKTTVREHLEESGKREIAILEKRNTLIEEVASIAPLLGLLGTVIGMVQVFRQIEAAGSTNIQFLSGGVYTALLTTVFGLVVAIPATILYFYFDSRINRLSIKLEAYALHLLDLLFLTPPYKNP